MDQRSRAGIRRSKTQGDLDQEFNGLSISKKKDRSNKKNRHAVDDSVFSGFKTSIYKKSGDRHEGYYKDGKREGHGVYLWANGDKYSGMWSAGLMHGAGRFNWSNGETYIGEWSDGKMTGKGQKLQIDGSMLEGTFNSGKLHGWGNKTFIEGDHFEGQFENDSRNGYGEYSWFDGSKYCGLWSRDDAHGVGVMERGHADLHRKQSSSAFSIDTYCGEYCNNRKEGLGTTTLTDGTIISGEFTWQRKKDLGRKKSPDGCLSLDDEVPSGWGHVTYSTADRGSIVADSPAAKCVSYEGDLRDGERDGMGIVRYRVSIHRRHPLLELALSAEDGEMQDCIHVVDSAAVPQSDEGSVARRIRLFRLGGFFRSGPPSARHLGRVLLRGMAGRPALRIRYDAAGQWTVLQRHFLVTIVFHVTCWSPSLL